jgi:hypothetical protein
MKKTHSLFFASYNREKIWLVFMPRTTSNDIEQDKLARFDRMKKAITALEKQQRQILKQGELAPSGAWVARYQVRQNTKKYWYYKLQMPTPYFQCTTSSKLSKYKHLGKAGTQAHIDAVMSVFRRSVWDEIQKLIDFLDDCLLSISSGDEQEEEEPHD